MTSSQGFSLIEVLITLLVILSTSFGLLTQQWQSLCLFNQAEAQFSECLTSDNAYELRLAGLKPLSSFAGGKK